jgi:kynurenine formamidase
MKKYIDLTLTLEDGMRGVRFEPARTILKDGWNAQTYHLYSHAGTHADAPIHFEANDGTIDKFPVERFFTTCYLVDLTGILPHSEIELKDLGEVAEKIQKGEGLIFKTGWSKYVHESQYRIGIPGISKKLAEWCVQKGVATIAVEPPSVADVDDLQILTDVHNILLKGDILIIEGLTNLEKITKTKVQIIALPLKIKNGDGAPCRVVAIENEI